MMRITTKDVMKKILLALPLALSLAFPFALLLLSLPAPAQDAPPPYAIYKFNGTAWTAATTTATQGAITYTPPALGAYCYNSSTQQWVPADSSCFGAGSGTVTTFSSGNLSPLFTTSVATPTTAPALSFSLSNAAQNAVLAGPTSGTGAPTYRALVAGDIPAAVTGQVTGQTNSNTLPTCGATTTSCTGQSPLTSSTSTSISGTYSSSQTNPSSAFDSAVIGPELTSSGCWTVSGNWTGTYATSFTHTAGDTTPLTCAISTTNLTYYQVQFAFTRTAGQLTVSIGGSNIPSMTSIQNNGTYIDWHQTDGAANLVFTPLSTFAGTVSVESVKLLTPAPAVITQNDSTGTLAEEMRWSPITTVAGVTNGNLWWGQGSGAHCNACVGNIGIGYGAQASAVVPNVGGYQPNTCVGDLCQNSLTNGYLNTAFGSRGQFLCTGCLENTSIGNDTLEQITIGAENTAVGHDALNSLTSTNDNTAIGAESMQLCTTCYFNSALGFESLYGITTGRYNSAIGYLAGRYIANGSTANQTGFAGTFLGAQTRAKADGDTNEIVIGGDNTSSTIGAGTNTVTVGNELVTDVYLGSNQGTGKATLHSGMLESGVTTFTVSGCGTAGSVTGTGTVGSFTVGTGATNCTFTVTLNGATGMTAPHGWVANGDDTTANIHCVNSATVSTTTVIFICTGTIATSDVIKFSAFPY